MYNRRVSKTDARIEACGTVDELNSALGMARATTDDPQFRERLVQIQKSLITVMGEIATLPADLNRYAKDGFVRVTEELVQPLEIWIRDIEVQHVSFKGWATPGATLHAAALDMARSICRRAERRIQALVEKGEIENGQILVFFNRLSDCLWLMARLVETREARES